MARQARYKQNKILVVHPDLVEESAQRQPKSNPGKFTLPNHAHLRNTAFIVLPISAGLRVMCMPHSSMTASLAIAPP